MNVLTDFVQALETARSTRQINVALNRFLQRLGFTMYSFTYYSYHPLSASKILYDYSSERYKSWHQHYLDQAYEDIDTTLDVVYQSTVPIFWDMQQQLREAQTEREKQMRLDSIAFGAKQGLSIPVHGPNDEFANLVIVQMQDESCLEKWRETQLVLMPACHFYYTVVKKQLLLEQPPIEAILSARELQCLQLLAKRYSVKLMAKTLSITERTVNFHIQNVLKKLKVKNKYQAVAKALEKGFLKL